MPIWTALLDILILLTAAMVLGAVADRLGQSPILGYLLAGTLLGPNALNLLPNPQAVSGIAELGVALLLFTIGLEFSWRRLRSVGPIALGGGTLQVAGTALLATLVAGAVGVEFKAAVAVGALIALSSTAAVIRLLAARAEIDTVHGRNAVGILLLQDIAVVPLVLLVGVLGGGGSAAGVGLAIARALGLALLLVAALHFALNRILPLLFNRALAGRNRDIPILLAIVTAVGAAWVSHELGISPILGAFVAGMLLAESPFAPQIRADIVPLQTLFVTLFFSSIGILADPAWVADHWPLLTAVVVAIVVGKIAVTAAVVRIFRAPLGFALATGLVLAQVGEFSLVLAGVALDAALIGPHTFDLIVAALTVTLFVTPYLTAAAPRVALAVGQLAPGPALPAPAPVDHADERTGHLVIVGFGPAGQRVAELLMGEEHLPIVVVDLNPASLELARAYGLGTQLGDATREEILEHARVREAAAVAVTIPDPRAARHIIQRLRALAPDTDVLVRSRYHVHRWQLDVAGAHVVVDEEDQVGARMAEEIRQRHLE
jgi:CPA2 family monovalent cation:H+ antiporter-2